MVDPSPRLAACHELFKHLPFEECCEQVAAAGFAGIELAPYLLGADPSKLFPGDARAACRAARAHGLALVAAHWLLASPPGMSITSPDPDVQARTRTFFLGLIDVLHAMDVPVLVFGSPKQRNIDASWGEAEARARGISFLAEMADACAERGMTIALEPLGPSTTNFAATFAEVVTIIDSVASTGLKMLLDVKAMHDDPVSPVDQIVRSGSRLVHVHVNDTNLLGPGMGDVDYLPIFDALHRAGYTGWFSVEVFRDDVAPVDVATRSRAYLADVMGRAGDNRKKVVEKRTM